MIMRLRQHIVSSAIGLSGALVAQQPFPTYADNGTWSLLRCITANGTWCFTETFTYGDSDTLCGHVWSVHSWPTFGTPGTAYIRNEGQRTLLRRSSDCLDKEYVLYDYSLDVGDSIHIPFNMDWADPDTALFFLRSIDTVQILGVERRRFSLLFDSCSTGVADAEMQWVEGIGSTLHPFYALDCLCDWCMQFMDLLCYDSTGVQLYQDLLLNTCDTTMMVGVPDLMPEEGPTFRIWQDPTNGTLVIQFDHQGAPAGAELSLLTADGRPVRRMNGPQQGEDQLTVPLPGIHGGVYLLQVSVRGERVAAERIVIQ